MVQFGKHILAIAENDNANTGLYLVPYNDIKEYTRLDESQAKASRRVFEAKWRTSLDQAVASFQNGVTTLWQDIFVKINFHDEEESRGAQPGIAIGLYAEASGAEATRELLVRFKQIREAAYQNSEALRKLVKKFDKNYPVPGNPLSPVLVPLVYAANFTIGQLAFEEAIGMLRTLLEGDENASQSRNEVDVLESSHHSSMVEGRQTELDWLTKLTASMDQFELSRLVAHRGFHSVRDHSHRRPNENSLTAYETAWTNGIHLCECDIALTKDEKLILAHDEDFSRLALDPKSPKSNRKVGDLTFKELMALPLTGFSRPSLLIDVLRSAHEIGEKAQLVIEIKPGNEAAAAALARMLLDYPKLVPCVAMIMSFDAYSMHNLRQELFNPDQDHRTSRFSTLPSRMNMVGGGSMLPNSLPDNSNAERGQARGHARKPTFLDEFGSGLTLNEANRRVSMMTPLEKLGFDKDLIVYPKLMLLTVADPANKACELQVRLADLSPIDTWLTSREGSLDGVYLQFQKEMLEPEGCAALEELGQRYHVGVWTYSGIDPDDYATFRTLVHQGKCRFVNTDLPGTFRKGVTAKSTSKKTDG